MKHSQKVQKRKDDIKKKLMAIKLPENSESSTCWLVGNELGVSGVTVKNYLNGKIADGYLAEEMLAILNKINKSK